MAQILNLDPTNIEQLGTPLILRQLLVTTPLLVISYPKPVTPEIVLRASTLDLSLLLMPFSSILAHHYLG